MFDGLTSLENLALSVNNISELHKDLFDGLDNLDKLILTKNKLECTARMGCFEGLGDLETLYLGEQPRNSPFTFTAELEQEGPENGVVVKVAEGAPFEHVGHPELQRCGRNAFFDNRDRLR